MLFVPFFCWFCKSNVFSVILQNKPLILALECHRNFSQSTMNKVISSALTAALVISLAACDSKARLADNIEGSWSGAPKTMSTDINGNTTIVEIISFLPGDIKNGGDFSVQAMISATGAVKGQDGLLLPYSLTASATAVAEGTWQAIDDDEIAINLDPASLKVTVDPDGVTLNDNALTGAETASVDSIRPEIVNMLHQRIQRDVMMRFLSIKHLDDVKIKSNLLKFEVGDDKFTMSRQP